MTAPRTLDKPRTVARMRHLALYIAVQQKPLEVVGRWT